eukprot:1159566-Pelagomonas_calceolata.AAC.8
MHAVPAARGGPTEPGLWVLRRTGCVHDKYVMTQVTVRYVETEGRQADNHRNVDRLAKIVDRPAGLGCEAQISPATLFVGREDCCSAEDRRFSPRIGAVKSWQPQVGFLVFLTCGYEPHGLPMLMGLVSTRLPAVPSNCQGMLLGFWYPSMADRLH